MDIVCTKSATLAAAALGAAGLIVTAAPAAAVPRPDYASNGVITVRYYDTPFGLTASIWDDNNLDGTVEVCHYASIGLNGALPFSTSSVLDGNGPGSVSIPGVPLGQRFNVAVHCEVTGETFNFTVTY